MKITVDRRYNLITAGWLTPDDWAEIKSWCKENGRYQSYITGIVYERDEDLTAFLLRWA